MQLQKGFRRVFDHLVLVDKLGSSKNENFIGFPQRTTGTELATRSVLQMLKFGAQMVAPVAVSGIDPAPTPNNFNLYIWTAEIFF